MSLKIGQVNLIPGKDDAGAAFSVMYKADDAFKANPPTYFGVTCYAGKKLLGACRNARHSNLSAEYSGDLSSPQGYTNDKGIKHSNWKDGHAVNMYYASAAGPLELQLAGGAKSEGVHTIVVYAGNGGSDGLTFMDAKVVTVGKSTDVRDNQGTSFETLGTAVAGWAIISVEEHDEKDKLGTEKMSAEIPSSRTRSLEDKIDSLMEVNMALINLLKNKL